MDHRVMHQIDARRVAELIRETADSLRRRTPDPKQDPAKSILIAFEALARTFEREADAGFDEESCPGHVASDHDAKICRYCGVHIDSLRPDRSEGT